MGAHHRLPLLLLLLLVALYQCCATRVVFGEMTTLVSMPYMSTGHFYSIQEDITNPGSFIASVENALVSITSDGHLLPLAGNISVQGFINGEAATAQFNSIQGVYQLPNGFVFISDSGNSCIRQLDRKTLIVSTLAGQCTHSDSVDGTFEEAMFSRPMNLVRLNDNKILTVDNQDSTVRNLDLNARYVNTVVRSLFPKYPRNIYVSGALLLISFEYAMLKTTNYKLSLFTGGVNPGTQDGSLVQARYNDIRGIAKLTDDVYVVCDFKNNKLRVLDLEADEVTSLCTGQQGKEDGDRDSCALDRPTSLTVVGSKLFIGEYGFAGGGLRVISFQVDGQCTPPHDDLKTVHYVYHPVKSDYLAGDEVTLTCVEGYKGPEAIQRCSNDSQWDGTTPNCTAVTCVNPPRIAHGLVDTVDGSYGYNSTVVYVCADGYKLSENANSPITCTQHGWSGDLPQCKSDTLSVLDKALIGSLAAVGGFLALLAMFGLLRVLYQRKRDRDAPLVPNDSPTPCADADDGHIYATIRDPEADPNDDDDPGEGYVNDVTCVVVDDVIKEET